MDDKDRSEQIVSLIIQSQSRLYSYILSLLADPDWADDVLQETNLLLWRKAHEFKLGTNFTGWAFRIAFFQVKAARKKRQRNRLVFSDDLLRLIAADAEARSADTNERRLALRKCLELLSSGQQRMLEQRYALGQSVKRIAAELGRPVGSIYQTLYRLRQQLMECIERRIAESSKA